MELRVLALVLGCLASPVSADIFKYVDDQGVTTYTNLPAKIPANGAQRVAVDPPPAPVPAPAGVPAPGGPARQKMATPANFPRVDSETQKKRDLSRKAILDEELKSEEKLLAEAKKAAAEGAETRQGDERNYAKYLERVKKLKDDVDAHEKNVAALRKELSGLK